LSPPPLPPTPRCAAPPRCIAPPPPCRVLSLIIVAVGIAGSCGR
jgi:hypothetical protein